MSHAHALVVLLFLMQTSLHFYHFRADNYYFINFSRKLLFSFINFYVDHPANCYFHEDLRTSFLNA